MSSADETERAAELLERLLVDPAFRAEFRRHPADAAAAHGLSDLAEQLQNPARALETLEVRESKSSLAGVMVAAASEGVGVAEFVGFLHSRGALSQQAADALHGAVQRASSRGVAQVTGGVASGGSLATPQQVLAFGQSPNQAPTGAAGSFDVASQAAAPNAAQGSAAPNAAQVPIQPAGQGSAPALQPAATPPPAALATPTPPATPSAAAALTPLSTAPPTPPAAVTPPSSPQAPASLASQPPVAPALAGTQLPLLEAPLGHQASGPPAPLQYAAQTTPPAAVSQPAPPAPGVPTPPAPSVAAAGVSASPNADASPVATAATTPQPGSAQGSVLPAQSGQGSVVPAQSGPGSVVPAPGSVVATPAGANQVLSAQPAAGTTSPVSADPTTASAASGSAAPLAAATDLTTTPPPASGAADATTTTPPGATSPAAGGAANQVGGAGVAALVPQPATALTILNNPSIALSAAARTALSQQAVDPRMLETINALARVHPIGVDNVGFDQFDIVATTGQPVSAQSIPARDIAEALATIDPNHTPANVSTPWPISGSGFYQDPSMPDRIHVVFQPAEQQNAAASLLAHQTPTSAAQPGQASPAPPTPAQSASGDASNVQFLRAVPTHDQAVVDAATPLANPGLLASGQARFASTLARLTGLDPRLIAAWALAEESGPAAAARQAADNHNWLNIGYFDSGPGSITQDQVWKNPVTAAQYTARFLQGSWGGASPGIRGILATAGRSVDAQIRAISSSGWASSGYGHGDNIRGTFQELTGTQADAATPLAAADAAAGAGGGVGILPGGVSPVAEKAIRAAEHWLGTPYSWGGGSLSGPTYGIDQGSNIRGFDCSGLVREAYAQAGIALPRTSEDQFGVGMHIEKSRLLPGDLIFFDGDPPGHVAMYIGDGRYIEAPQTGGVVQISQIDNPWAQAHYTGARRYT